MSNYTTLYSDRFRDDLSRLYVPSRIIVLDIWRVFFLLKFGFFLFEIRLFVKRRVEFGDGDKRGREVPPISPPHICRIRNGYSKSKV